MLSKLLAPLLENKLTKQQKHATAILSIGTILEYFDLYLYVHIAFIMDQIFFPPGSAHSWLLSKLNICTNFMFRPLGAIIFGWLGDNFGRKSTIFISTTATSICCAVTAYLPSYEEIGMTAAFILTACRIAQGIFSATEVQGARIYLMEISENIPKQCFLSNLIPCFSTFGRLVAIVIANIFISMGGQSWRKAFIAGAIIAFVGAYARSSLKETPEFADARKRLKNMTEELKSNVRNSHPLLKAKLDVKDTFYLFVLRCGAALAMPIIYTYCPKIFSNMGLSQTECINYSTYASFYDTVMAVVLMLSTFYFNPLKIIKVLVYLGALVLLVVPIILHNFSSPIIVFLCQIAMLTFMISDYPASAVLYKRFPVLQRFTSILMINALSRALVWPICTIGIGYLTEKVFGHYGLYIIFLPMSVLSIMAVRHFIEATEKDQLENKKSVESKTLQNV